MTTKLVCWKLRAISIKLCFNHQTIVVVIKKKTFEQTGAFFKMTVWTAPQEQFSENKDRQLNIPHDVSLQFFINSLFDSNETSSILKLLHFHYRHCLSSWNFNWANTHHVWFYFFDFNPTWIKHEHQTLQKNKYIFSSIWWHTEYRFRETAHIERNSMHMLGLFSYYNFKKTNLKTELN